MALTCKDLGSLHSHPGNEDKWDKVKIGAFIWVHQRIEVIGQMSSQNLEKEEYPESMATKICLPGAQAYRAIKLKKDGNFETETRLA